MPGSNRRALDKGRTLPADGLILDLEDAVAPDAKEAARATVREALEARAAYGGRELIVRVNGLGTPWGHDDLASMAAAQADAILLPKVESTDLVYDGNASRHPSGRGGRRPSTGRVSRHGHFRSDHGPYGATHAHALADARLARDLPAC